MKGTYHYISGFTFFLSLLIYLQHLLFIERQTHREAASETDWAPIHRFTPQMPAVPVPGQTQRLTLNPPAPDTQARSPSWAAGQPTTGAVTTASTVCVGRKPSHEQSQEANSWPPDWESCILTTAVCYSCLSQNDWIFILYFLSLIFTLWNSALCPFTFAFVHC